MIQAFDSGKHSLLGEKFSNFHVLRKDAGLNCFAEMTQKALTMRNYACNKDGIKSEGYAHIKWIMQNMKFWTIKIKQKWENLKSGLDTGGWYYRHTKERIFF